MERLECWSYIQLHLDIVSYLLKSVGTVAIYNSTFMQYAIFKRSFGVLENYSYVQLHVYTVSYL